MHQMTRIKEGANRVSLVVFVVCGKTSRLARALPISRLTTPRRADPQVNLTRFI